MRLTLKHLELLLVASPEAARTLQDAQPGPAHSCRSTGLVQEDPCMRPKCTEHERLTFFFMIIIWWSMTSHWNAEHCQCDG